MRCTTVGCGRNLTSGWLSDFPGIDKCPDHALSDKLCQVCDWRFVRLGRADIGILTCGDPECSSVGGSPARLTDNPMTGPVLEPRTQLPDRKVMKGPYYRKG